LKKKEGPKCELAMLLEIPRTIINKKAVTLDEK